MAILIRFFAIVFLTLAMGKVALGDNGLQLHEQEIKAGLLYNFLKYIEWPDSGPGGIKVCVFGDDPFNGYLQPMAGRTVNQRRIELHAIHDLPATIGCDLLFINAAEKDRWPDIQKYLAGKKILTVSDLDDFASNGGMIEFSRKDSHIIVSLNIDALTAAQLRVEDRLLKLVTVMRPAEGH